MCLAAILPAPIAAITVAEHGALPQASLLYSSGGDVLASALQVSSAERTQVREALSRRMVGLDEFATELPPMDAIAVAYEEELQQVDLVMREARISAREEQAAAEFYAERYRPLTWP